MAPQKPNAAISEYDCTDELATTVASNGDDVVASKVFDQLDLSKNEQLPNIPPFSLLNSANVQEVRVHAAVTCRVHEAQIADVMPCTPMQKGMMAATNRNTEAYVTHFSFKIDAGITVQRLRDAWDVVNARTPILRTRLASLANHGVVQIVVDEAAEWTSHDSYESYKEWDRGDERCMDLGSRLTNVAIVNDQKAGDIYFLLKIHHALYDGWSIPLLLGELERVYYGEDSQCLTPMSSFVNAIQRLDHENHRKFWRSQFAGLQDVSFQFSGVDVMPADRRDNRVHHSSSEVDWTSSHFTKATLARAAWSLVLARTQKAKETVFGAITNGRQADIAGIEHMQGPTIAVVPVRVMLDRDQDLLNLLEAVQNQSIEMIRYEQTGLERIRQMGDAAAKACQFQSLLVVQPASIGRTSESSRPFLTACKQNGESVSNNGQGWDYPLEVDCYLSDIGISTEIAFDCRSVEDVRARQIGRAFHYAISQLATESNLCQKVGELADSIDSILLGIDMIRAWNSQVPEPVEECIHNLVSQRAKVCPTAMAICSWDGELTYQELDELSSVIARDLVLRNIQGTLVPLLFEKSLWMPLAVLSVLKAGGAVVALDMKQPVERLATIVSQTDSPILLCSQDSSRLASRLVSQAKLILGPNLSELSHKEGLTDVSLPSVRSTDLLYVVFTSGSTGTPKGVMITHGNFASAMKYQQQSLGYNQSCRVLDFASYAFDVAWSNMFNSLAAGACLCIPSPDERENNLAESIGKYEVNFVDLTPSVVRALGPSALSKIETLILGGEVSAPGDASMAPNATHIVNAYGPAETTPTSLLTIMQEDSHCIGRGAGVCTWILDPDQPGLLVHLGAVGELWIEGPLVGEGYWRAKEATEVAFIQDPKWLQNISGRSGRVYRTGDLVRYREDGTLIFVGRKDTQVKVRGQRVDLNEVEACVGRMIEVQTTNVVAEMIYPPGSNNPILVAFITLLSDTLGSENAHNEAVRVATSTLSQKLSNALPSYMVPSCFYGIQNLPVTSTGKTDRRLLREIGVSTFLQNRYPEKEQESPTEQITEVEEILQKIWMSILRITKDEASLDAPFSSLGGDSISAMQLVSRCRLQNVAFTVRDVLQTGTIRQLAARCHGVTQASVKNSLLNEDNEQTVDPMASFGLTPIQQAFFNLYPDGLNHYNQAYILEVRNDVSANVLRTALEEFVNEHGMLRARFQKESSHGPWTQRVVESGPSSFSFAESTAKDHQNLVQLIEMRQQSLDITNGPVFSSDLIQIPDGRRLILLTAHHLVIDLVSWRILRDSLEEYVKFGKMLLPETKPFQSWSKALCKMSQHVSPLAVLPYPLPEPQLSFWDFSSDENTVGRSTSVEVYLSHEATTLLLGKSNRSLRTEALDLILGSLLYSFHHAFPERPIPPIWNEGYGREQLDSLPIDVSNTVGWFTVIYPIVAHFAAQDTIEHVVRVVKDLRRRIPGKGQLFYACQHYNQTGREMFGGHDIVELVINFVGRTQDIENYDDLFKAFRSLDGRSIEIPTIADCAKRPAVIDMTARVSNGQFGLTCDFPSFTKYKTRILQWMQSFERDLESLVRLLETASTRLTMSDIPLLELSYHSLDKLTNESFPSKGIDAASIIDMYPCFPMQEGILLSIAKGSASYATVTIGRVLAQQTNADLCPTKLERAWRSLIERHAMLSTVFVLHPESKSFIQAVLDKPSIRVVQALANDQDPIELLSQLEKPSFQQNEPPHMLTICSSVKGELAFRIDMSHAITDTRSISILLEELAAAYSETSLAHAPQVAEMVRHAQNLHRSQSTASWSKLLDGIEPCVFPLASMGQSTIPQRLGCIKKGARCQPDISRFCKESGISLSALLHIAWALVLSHYTGMGTVCFGYTSSGRDALVDGVDGLVAPLANLLVAKIDLSGSVATVLENTTANSQQRLSLQHSSLSEVQRELGLSGRTLFNTSLSIQQAQSSVTNNSTGISFHVIEREDAHEYPLALKATIDGDAIKIRVEHSVSEISHEEAQRIYDILVEAMHYIVTATRAEDGEKHDCHPLGSDDKFNSLFTGFFEHLTGVEMSSAAAFWSSKFSGIQECHFPALSSTVDPPRVDGELHFELNEFELINGFDSPESLVHAAWSMVVTRMMGTNDSILGTTTSGIGGTTVLPVRITIDPDEVVQDFVGRIESQNVAGTPFQRMNVDAIRRISSEAAIACNYQTLLIIEQVGKPDTPRPSTWHTNRECPLKIIIQVRRDALHLAVKFDSRVIEESRMLRLVQQFQHVLRQLVSPDTRKARVGDVAVVSPEDLHDLWVWNAVVPEPVTGCIHDLVVQRAIDQPHAVAIDAWDGNLTYLRLHEASTHLAHRLIAHGVGPGSIVPLCFEKSMWQPIAVLAVMKAGGASVAIETSLPEARIRSIIRQAFTNMERPRIILSSTTKEPSVREIGADNVLVPSSALLEGFNSSEYPQLPPVDSSNPLYVTFTSGSTGEPKGIVVTHQNFMTAIAYQRDALGIHRESRIFAYASYAFDITWLNKLMTLTAGACLCIPSAAEREDDLGGSLIKYAATAVDLTPSLARIVQPRSALSNLSTLILGGEAVLPSDANLTADSTRIIVAYGPAECTPVSTLMDLSKSRTPASTVMDLSKSRTAGIGRGVGTCTWVVEIGNPNMLAPIGAVGELCIEGPLVTQGYLNDPERTKTSFLTDPPWLTRSGNPSRDRKGRVYRTGDLARYNEDGSLVFVGRIDTQVKINGQRVELGDIEQHVREAFENAGLANAVVVAEVLQPEGINSKVVVAFVSTTKTASSATLTEAVQRMSGEVDKALAAALPRYMLPSRFLPLEGFPMTVNGKIDRRRLQEIGTRLLGTDYAASSTTEKRSPSTDAEKAMQKLWAEVLSIDIDTIGADDNFFKMGGDSIGAIHLVAKVRDEGGMLRVQDVFQSPTLRELCMIHLKSS